MDIVDSIQVRSGPQGTAEVKGRAIVHALAVGGMIQPTSSDFSGLAARASVGPVVINMSVAQLVPNLLNELTPVAYRCAGSTLTLTGQSGTPFTFVKA